MNVRSLTSCFMDFSEYFLAKDFSAILVSETWLTPNISANAVALEGYRLIRRDREMGGRGGGVAMYLKNTYQYTILGYDNSIEDLWVCIKFKNTNIALGCVYKAPKFNNNIFINEFETRLFNIMPMCDQLICLGDFNIDQFNINHTAVYKLNNILESAGLKQIINTPTRVTYNSSTLIDYIICSEECNYSDYGTCSLSHISDHEMLFIYLKLDAGNDQARPDEFRDFKNIDVKQLYADVQSIPWRNIYDIDNINGKVEFFNTNIITLLELHAPIRILHFKKRPKPWITDNIKFLISLKNKAMQKFKNTKKLEDWNSYKDLRNFTTASIKREKKAYLRNQLKKDKKDIWGTLKKLNIYNKHKNKTIPDNLSDPDEINNYFINSVPPTNNTINVAQHYESQNLTTSLKFRIVTETEVSNYLLSIKTNAVGADGIHIKFLILCCPFILPYVCHIVNFCINNSVFPDIWKLAQVIPLPKTDSPKEYKDLRPISILPVLSKILEFAIKDQLVEYIENNNILPYTQSGFRKGYSCATALLNVIDNILEATDSGKLTVLVLLDYSKAFDTINHKTLCSILKFIGLGDHALRFFENYLKDRKQRVVLNKNYSEYVNTLQGVPQGSILGPVLFSIYTASFANCIMDCKIQSYADDIQLFFSFYPNNLEGSCNIINNDLERIHKFSLEHSLHLNPDKCVAMLFGRRVDRIKYKEDIAIQINDAPIQFKDEVKSLGLWLDTSLRFEKHVSLCIKKSFSALKVLYNSKDILNTKLKLMLCESLVLSNFNYCDTVYGPCLTLITSQRIQKIQNYCLRFAYGIKKYEHISHKLRDSNWLNMKDRRTFHCGTLYHKVINLKKPSYLYRKISFRTDVHNLNIRYKGTLTPPLHKSSLYERSYSYNIVALYNPLPVALKSLSPSCFRNQYQKFLLANASA